jgi:hypothetical protein
MASPKSHPPPSDPQAQRYRALYPFGGLVLALICVGAGVALLHRRRNRPGRLGRYLHRGPPAPQHAGAGHSLLPGGRHHRVPLPAKADMIGRRGRAPVDNQPDRDGASPGTAELGRSAGRDSNPHAPREPRFNVGARVRVGPAARALTAGSDSHSDSQRRGQWRIEMDGRGCSALMPDFAVDPEGRLRTPVRRPSKPSVGRC